MNYIYKLMEITRFCKSASNRACGWVWTLGVSR